MDALPADICYYILQFVEYRNFSLWCRLSSRYYIIYHNFLRGKQPLLETIIRELCINGNLDYLKYIMTITVDTCPKYRPYWRTTYTQEALAAGEANIDPATGMEVGMNPTSYQRVGTFMSDEIIRAADRNHTGIVNYLTSLFPEYVQVDISVTNKCTPETVISLLDNNRLFVLGIGLWVVSKDDYAHLVLDHPRLLKAERMMINILCSAKLPTWQGNQENSPPKK